MATLEGSYRKLSLSNALALVFCKRSSFIERFLILPLSNLNICSCLRSIRLSVFVFHLLLLPFLRLLLIPEKFRSTIAQFVDREVQPTNYQEVSPSPSPPPAPSSSLPLPPPIAPEVVQAPTPPLINSNTKAKVQDTFNAPKPPVAFGKRVYRDNRFDEFLVRVKQTHKIINNDFLNMQKILMDFEHACQKERDAKIVSFIKSINYDF
ncbi:uncharacterized protein LOC118735626 isoform X2 [Rhagoletis pomonella]|uniref:uncharacterized protein LOC118735626 isoform X2 n=1 Tax=Rhagoletis pomonella TaxID=28610 RepID=UPI001783A137|nr:uncharacterized protein LOC118735626 isoform X2 [Rhagoletis pomonella]